MPEIQRASIGIFTGGGTGGHVYPGLAVWQQVQQWWPGPLLWVGSKSGMEKAIVADAGLPFLGIPAGKLRRYWSFRNLTDVARILAGFLHMLLFLLRHRVAFVFSKGGFVTVPVVWAAALFRIPVFSHESDLVPGLATRLNLPFSRRLYVCHTSVRGRLPARFRSRVEPTGNPIREQVRRGDAERARQRWNIPDGLPLILVLGGSSGAVQINRLVPSLVESLRGRAFVLHQTGPHESARETPLYRSVAYLGGAELADALAATALLISRAGAGSLWEAAWYRLPMVLIPLTSGSRGDQVVNARHWEHLGCAHVLIDPSAESLTRTVIPLITDSSALRAMRDSFPGPPIDAASLISDDLRRSLVAP